MNGAFDQARERFLAGVVSQEAGHWAAAEAHYRASLALLPERPSALCNLGTTLLQAGRADEALPLLVRATQLTPDDGAAWAHQGMALVALQRDEEALSALTTALQAGQDRADLHWQRTQALLRLGRPEQAQTACAAVLALAPDDAVAWALNGSLLKDLGRSAQAITALQRAIALGADTAVNAYLLASLQGHGAPPQPPAGYVQSLFDGYAAGFDAHLIDKLRYCAPAVLGRHLRTSGRRFASALDLGCGTGLCAPELRPLAERLTGVDLSSAMLEQARARGLYDRLVQRDIGAHLLAEAPAQHDLVLAADVFIYVGALDTVFAGVRRALQPGGLFCFSVEQADDTVDHTLRPSSRYAHSARYLQSLAASHGFVVQRLWQDAVRNDQGQAVAGLYAALIGGDGR
ncbi:MAG: tetratricopeptide repeat protein [Rubrivivax sp.]|nr:tetratricopeptide repeat protein [Rubrivivax sp.]